MKRTIIAALFLTLACTTTSTPPAKAPASQYKNLQVLPKDIQREQLLATMRSFTRSLGVKCNFCHVVTATDPKEQLDFASDAKDEKRNARTMLRMTQDINHEWLTKFETKAEDRPNVTCWTCHRGKPQPEEPPAPPEK